MKKWVLSLIFILTLSSLPAFSATPPKPGSSCSKQGISRTYKGMKYTCIKSGKKLVWNKGVVIMVSSHTPTTTPTYSPTPTPTPSPTPSPTPTPTLSFPISGNDSLLPVDSCRLLDSSGNNFHLGFPITPIIKDLSRIRIFAIPFEFTDSYDFRISFEQTNKMFGSISDYFLKESYGRTRLEFTIPQISGSPGRIGALSLDVQAKDSPLTKKFTTLDFTTFITQLLAKTPRSWNLENYDAIVLYSQDFRTFNFLGGQAWRGTKNSQLGQVPFDSPSGMISSLVFASGIPTVLIHELGHSLFGLIDLYDQRGGQSFAQGWGLMASAYSGELNLRGWEKWLAGWLNDDDIRCSKLETSHYLEFISSGSKTPKLIIHPLSNQRAVVIEAINTNSIAQEFNGNLLFCDSKIICPLTKSKGLFAYVVDVSKLSALGAIVVPQELQFPNLLSSNLSISIEGVVIRNLGCDTNGCFVSIGR